MSDPIDKHPIGGVDYPQTVQEFDKWFPNKESCATYLMNLRWPKGFICSACGGTKAWKQMRCAGC